MARRSDPPITVWDDLFMLLVLIPLNLLALAMLRVGR